MGLFLWGLAPFFDIFFVVNLSLTPSFVGSNPATPVTDAIYCVILRIYTQDIAFYFLLKNFYARNCGVVCGVNCGVKSAENKPRKRGLILLSSAVIVIVKAHNLSFVPRCRGIRRSSRYSPCPRRRSLRLYRTNAQPRASPPPNCTLLPLPW